MPYHKDTGRNYGRCAAELPWLNRFPFGLCHESQHKIAGKKLFNHWHNNHQPEEPDQQKKSLHWTIQAFKGVKPATFADDTFGQGWIKTFQVYPQETDQQSAYDCSEADCRSRHWRKVFQGSSTPNHTPNDSKYLDAIYCCIEVCVYRPIVVSAFAFKACQGQKGQEWQHIMPHVGPRFGIFCRIIHVGIVAGVPCQYQVEPAYQIQSIASI